MNLGNRKTRKLIAIMSVLVLITLSVTYFYYRNQNNSVDPRIISARSLYEKYNAFTQENAYDSIFRLMDTIESIYISVGHYQESYEVGVLYNNRAAAYLNMAIHEVALDSIHRDSIIMLGERAVRTSIGLYNAWIKKYSNLNREEIKSIVSADFFESGDFIKNEKNGKYLENRIREIQDAQEETKRRLSVSLTNLGIIFRYQQQYDSAAHYYVQALELWDRNLTAENNLNLLLNRPVKERNIIQQIFPAERIK